MKKHVYNKQIPNLDFKNTSYRQLSTVQQRSTFYLFGMLVFGVLGQRKKNDYGTCSCKKKKILVFLYDVVVFIKAVRRRGGQDE